MVVIFLPLFAMYCCFFGATLTMAEQIGAKPFHQRQLCSQEYAAKFGLDDSWQLEQASICLLRVHHTWRGHTITIAPGSVLSLTENRRPIGIIVTQTLYCRMG